MPISLAISIGIHAFILALRFDGPSTHDESPTARNSHASRLPAVRLVRIAPQPPTGSSRLSTLTVEPASTAPSVESPSAFDLADAEARPPGSAAVPSTVREPASPQLDPLLLHPLVYARPRMLDRAGTVDDPLDRKIASLNDSMALVAEAEQRAASWTLPDIDSEQWSIGLDAVRLGGLVVPFRHCSAGPCSGSLFAAPPGRRTEYASRIRMYMDIQGQASRAELRTSIGDRIRAIRVREHARRDSSGGGGGHPDGAQRNQ